MLIVVVVAVVIVVVVVAVACYLNGPCLAERFTTEPQHRYIMPWQVRCLSHSFVVDSFWP